MFTEHHKNCVFLQFTGHANIIFQQDGALRHFDNVLQSLNTNFELTVLVKEEQFFTSPCTLSQSIRTWRTEGGSEYKINCTYTCTVTQQRL